MDLLKSKQVEKNDEINQLKNDIQKLRKKIEDKDKLINQGKKEENNLLENNNPFSLFNSDNLNSKYLSKENYSYYCPTPNIDKKIKVGTMETSIQLLLQNNGKLDWSSNKVELKVDKEISNIRPDNLEIGPLKCNEKVSLTLKFPYLNYLSPSINKCYFDFCVNGQIYGQKICVSIEIIN